VTLAAEMVDLGVKLGNRVILKHLNCQIAAGQITALVGESGSGKSTLLYTMNGLVRPNAGRLTVLGLPFPPANADLFRRRIGFAVQSSALMPHLSAFDNLTLMAKLTGWPPDKTRERFDKLMSVLGLDSALGEHYPHQLSGGQQQRISLGRAFMLNPEMLLLDEPFSAVDPITRSEIYDRFEALMEIEPKSVVIVTHNLAEAERLADQIIVLKEGEIVQQGEVSVIRRHPANDYVARLFV